MGIKVIIFLFVFIIAFFVYKFISYQLRKTTEESRRIIEECKTEEERIKEPNILKKKNIKRSILYYFLFMVVFLFLFLFLFLLVSGDKKYQYGFTALDKKDLEQYKFSLAEIIDNPELVTQFPNKIFSPSEYDIGRVFKDYDEIEEYFVSLYGHKSKYNNKEQFEIAKETGIFMVTSVDQKIRTFIFTDEGIVLKSYKGKLSFHNVFSNYDENDYKLIKEVFPGIFETSHIYKYYNHENGIYKYSFFNAGHLQIGLNRIEFVK